ncbi:MAG: alpha/beta fold hydrolase [Gemmataceae bacterium]
MNTTIEIPTDSPIAAKERIVMTRWITLILLVAWSFFSRPLFAEEGLFDSNGVIIRYVTEGKGEAVVLIHGWMGDSSTWGQDKKGNTQLKPSEGFRVIALDCRGHGKSDKPHDPAKYGPEMGADVVRLLDHLKIERAHLVGYSSGAFLAGWVAGNHPDRVLSVVFGGQAPVITGHRKPTDFSECDTFATAVEEGKDLGSYIIATIPAGKPKPTEEQAASLAKFFFQGKDVKAFAAAGRGFKNLEVTEEQLKKYKAPILFIHGGEESLHVKSRVALVRKLLDRGEVTIIEGANHMTTRINPKFGSGVRDFILASKPK